VKVLVLIQSQWISRW